MLVNYVNFHHILTWRTKSCKNLCRWLPIKKKKPLRTSRNDNLTFQRNCYLEIACYSICFTNLWNRSNVKENFKLLYMSYIGPVFYIFKLCRQLHFKFSADRPSLYSHAAQFLKREHSICSSYSTFVLFWAVRKKYQYHFGGAVCNIGGILCYLSIKI